MTSKQNDYSAEAAARTGEAIAELSAHMTGYREWPVRITGLSIRGPRFKDDEFLVTVRGVDVEDARFVAFHSAFELGDCLRGVVARAKNGTLKWKVDEFDRK
jgi:hypothetical protein